MTGQRRLGVALLVVSVVAHACGKAESDDLPWEHLTVDEPREVVAEVYAFAAKHRALLSKIPCYCGCQRLGHRAVVDCFVVSTDGAVEWNSHAMGCGVCIQVGRDAMLMALQRIPTVEIVKRIDSKYLPVYGSSTADGHRR